LTRTLYWDE